jgi:uncharacterized membrane protein
MLPYDEMKEKEAMMEYGNTHELSWLWMLIPMVLLFATVAFTVLVTTRNNGSSRDQGSSAQSILDRRYARGEISAEELGEARRTLGVA